MSYNWLEPDNIDDEMLNWAAWYNSEQSVNEPVNPVSLKHAAAVDLLFNLLHFKEKQALRGSYLGSKCFFTEAALFTAKQFVESGLRERKLLK